MDITSREGLDLLMTPLVDHLMPVTLQEMNRVQLMDRADTKYVMHIAGLPAVLREAENQYNVLEVSGNRNRRYETHYFDSADYGLYRMHHNGKARRYKLRIRRYVDTDQTFYELKSRNHKRRTVKTRVQVDGGKLQCDILAPFQSFCPKEIGRLDHILNSLTVHFDRLTLVHKEKPERITIDTGLVWNTGSSCRSLLNLCIVEVKQPRDSSSPFSRIMQQNRIFPLRISKYCLGMILHHQDLKKNNFKPRMLRLQKILNSYKTDNYIKLL